MWRNPKYAAPEPAAPPEEQGTRLATFARGKTQELRVTLSEYNGRPFVSLRVWEQGQDGAWWPLKGKGCSVRVGEAAELAQALSQVEGLLAGPGHREGPQARRDPGRQPAAQGRTRGDRTPRPDPPFEPTQAGATFDEF